MPTDPKSNPVFRRGRRWKIGFDVLVRTLLVLAVVVMVNYLGAQFFHRFYLSSQTRVQLSSRTLSVLHSLTNHVAVTLYYDRDRTIFIPTSSRCWTNITRRTRTFPSGRWITCATRARRKR